MIDSDEIKAAATRCKLAYDAPDVKHLNEQWRLEKTSDSQVLSIAGSNDIIDWLQNLDLHQIEFYGKTISKGVVEASLNIAGQVMPNLDPDIPVKVEGHSAGGGKAQAVALDLHERGFDIERVTTFATPKITRKRFEYPFYVVNVEAFGDPVPFVPCWRPWRPWRLSDFFWRHNATRVVRLGRRTVSKMCSQWLLIRRMIKHHLMSNYCELIA